MADFGIHISFPRGNQRCWSSTLETFIFTGRTNAA